MKKTTLTLTVIGLLFSIFSAFLFSLTFAQTSIIIKADGSIEGTNNIQQTGNIYTLTSNLSMGIQVQKSNIILDGAGYTIKGIGNVGIDLSNGRGQDPSRPEIINVTIKNLYILNFSRGIEVVNTSNNTIIGNYIAFCDTGINIMAYENNVLIINNTLANNVNSIAIAYSNGNQTIVNNNMISDIIRSDVLVSVWLSTQPTIDKNYWSDYNGTDANNDGIGDTPYLQSIQSGTPLDLHPLMKPISILPEFSSLIFLSFFILTTLLTILIYFKKHKR